MRAHNTRFVVLDSWRGVCALLVAVHNLNFGPWVPQATFVAHSWLFVDFFFVLSGFVITHAYLDKLGSVADVASFVLRRVGRLWPLQATILIALIGMWLVKSIIARLLHLPVDAASNELEHSLRSIIANFLLIQSFDVPSWRTWNTPSWSISTELWTYFLFALICLLSLARERSVLIIVACGVLVSGAMLFLFSPDFLGTNTDYAFFRCIYGFFIGHLVYRVWENPIRLSKGEIAETLAVISVFGFVLVTGGDIRSMAAPLVFGFAIWVFAQERGYLSNLLKARAFIQLGIWSYSIYMVHWLVRNIVVQLEGIVDKLVTRDAFPSYMSFNNPWTMRVVLAMYLVVVILLAAFTYRFVEQPGRRYFNRIADRVLKVVPNAGPVKGSAADGGY
jgi:peptidoglycan/LPS O-acetylase OafA/YrhL